MTKYDIIDNKFGVIGTKEQVIPFIALGAVTVIAEDINAALKGLKEMLEEKFAIILINDDYLPDCADVLKNVKEGPTPAIISIPGRDGTSKNSQNMMNSYIKKAIGISMDGDS